MSFSFYDKSSVHNISSDSYVFVISLTIISSKSRSSSVLQISEGSEKSIFLTIMLLSIS